MCVKCDSLRQRIEQTKRAIAIGLDDATSARIADFAAKLEAELAAVIKTPGHQD